MFSKDISTKLKESDVRSSVEGYNLSDNTKNSVVKTGINDSRGIKYNLQSLHMEELMFSVVRFE